MVALVPLVIACASSDLSHPKAALVRLAYQPIGRQIVAHDILVIRGVLQSCLAWRGRVLDFVTVGSSGPIRLLYAIDISPIGMWPADVRDSILTYYLSAQPNGPTLHVTVEVMNSPEFDEQLAKETAMSLLAIYSGLCPSDPPDPPDWWSESEVGY
jgi:hypothetical protein